MNCEHLHVTVEWKLYAIATLEEPAEYVGRAFCDDCSETMEPEEVQEDAERKEIFV